mmetsp:Transcript_27534/g.74116  ORF Transcript_27534/g.74116 Transcript_27534/m.74116 type:complete len:210 (-) Transcript_27534:651-1280(-)
MISLVTTSSGVEGRLSFSKFTLGSPVSKKTPSFSAATCHTFVLMEGVVDVGSWWGYFSGVMREHCAQFLRSGYFSGLMHEHCAQFLRLALHATLNAVGLDRVIVLLHAMATSSRRSSCEAGRASNARCFLPRFTDWRAHCRRRVSQRHMGARPLLRRYNRRGRTETDRHTEQGASLSCKRRRSSGQCKQCDSLGCEALYALRTSTGALA